MSRRRLLAIAAAVVAAALPGSRLSAEPLAVRGIVTDAGGSGLAGVRVELLPIPGNREVQLALLARRAAPEASAAAATDAAGRFSLAAPGPGVYRVVARADGFVPMRYFLLPVARSVELATVALRREEPSPLTVADEAGDPVAGAAVYAQSASPGLWKGFAGNGWQVGARLGWTDSHGAVVLSRARGERLDVSVVVPGGGGTHHRDTTGGLLTVDRTPAWRRPIEVRDAEGRAVAGVVVAAGGLAWPVGRTGPDGRLVVGAGDEGPLAVRLFADPGRRRDADLERGEGPAVWTLPEPEWIEGRVVEAGGGQGVAGALVWPAHDPGSFVLTDSSGGYRLAAPPGRRFRAQADAAGHLARAIVFDLDGAHLDRVTPLELEPAAGVAGRVVDEAGAPLSGVRLETFEDPPAPRPPAFRPDPAASRAVTGPGGEFSLGNLHPQATYAVSARMPGFTETTAKVLAPGAAATGEPLQLVLRRGRLAFGRVLGLDERPLGGARVELRRAAPLRNSDAAQSPVSASTDVEGRFEVRRLPAPRLDITAQRPGFAPFTVRGVEVPAGTGPVDLGTLLLAPGATVRGLVTEPDGTPVAGAGVWIAADLARLRRALGNPAAGAGTGIWGPADIGRLRAELGEPDAAADGAGRFALEDLEPGREVHLLVDRAGYLPAASAAIEAPNREPIRVILKPAASLAGRVVDERGEPVAGADVSLRPASAADVLPKGGQRNFEVPATATRTDERGAFVLRDVARGRAAVSAWAEGFQPSATLELTVAGRENPADLELVLRRGGTLEGRIHDVHGEPIGGARIRAGRPAAESDAGGFYRLTGLAPGPGRLVVDHPGYNLLAEDVEIEPGVSVADFLLEGGLAVAGRVVDEEDLPVGGVFVELRHEDEGRGYRTTTDDRGGFGWPRVARGRYGLLAAKEGFVDAALDGGLDLGDGPAEDLRVVLRRGASIAGRILGLEAEDLARVRIEAAAGDRRLPGRLGGADAYEIADVPPGDWLVRAWIDGTGRQAEARVALSPGEPSAWRDLEFGGGLTLTGQVLVDGEPLAGADLSLSGHDVASERAAATDGRGLFRIEDLEPGRYRIGVSHLGRSVVHNEDVALAADLDLLIQLDLGGIGGIVVSAATSEPVADALVVMRQLLAAGEGSLFTVGTDARGVFRQAPLAAGRYRLEVQANGFEPAQRTLDLAPGLTIDHLEIALSPASGLDLVVRLASGASPHYVHLLAADASGRPVVSETRVADGAGAVRFATVPRGAWNLLVSAPGGAAVRRPATVPGDPIAVTLPAAGRLRVRVPELLETSLVATLAVIGPNGRPFQHLDMGGRLHGEWRLAAGTATVEGVPAGYWTLVVTSPGGRSWTGSAVTTGGPDIAISLE